MKIVAQKENEKEAEILEKYSPVYTRFCTNCGSPLEYDSVFCSECGNKIEEFDEEIAKNQKISPDRMASILETAKIKEGNCDTIYKGSEFLKKNPQKVPFSPGYYVYKGKNMTQYLSIDDIQGTIVKATVRTNFDNLSYAAEFYEGSFSDNKLNLHIITSDLHPIPGFSIMLSENFTGTVTENTISGRFTGEFSNFVVFSKC